MDDGILKQNNINMGATSNTNVARLAALQERKKAIEEILSKKDKELRELCIQEADLTGIVPSEMPLQPGESPPSIRRKIGTSYMLSENLLKAISNKDETIADLELQLQLHANLAEAALGLAHKQNLSKTVRRQHKSEYQHHKREYKALQEKIALLKDAQLIQQQNPHHQNTMSEKHKKKPRPPDQDDGISIKSSDPFRRSDHRQSSRSLRHTLQTDNISELYPHFQQRTVFNNNRSSEVPYEVNQIRYDDLSSSFYKLNFSEYKSYMERQENHTLVYDQLQPNYHQHILNSPTYQHSSLQLNHGYSTLQQQPSPHSQHSPISHVQQQSPQNSEISNLSFSPKYANSNARYYQTMVNLPYQGHHPRYGNSVNVQLSSRQSSPNLSTNVNKFQYSNSPVPSHSSQHSLVYNPHQLQPHQQYEHNAGLGGCWKKKENGETIWLNSSNSGDSGWHRDKRFGSLDRRKNRRIQKRISPNIDNKSATLASVPYTIENNKTVMHSPQVQTRHTQDRQLVRTQSLGSVGVQTIDGVWPSDDNSSCDSENRGSNRTLTNTIRRQKQKEWRETSLDGPESSILSYGGRCQSTIPAPILAPEEKYIPTSGKPSPVVMTTAKSTLEIPAESNPSPRTMPDANLELFKNNNMPKNCTLVQAGHCKPYHEETKPFEMSDFYKYSTKFKKSPSKNSASVVCAKGDEKSDWGSAERPNFTRNLNDNFENGAHRRNLQVMECATLQSPMNFALQDNLSNNLMEKQQCYNQERWYGCSQTSQKENNNATLV